MCSCVGNPGESNPRPAHEGLSCYHVLRHHVLQPLDRLHWTRLHRQPVAAMPSRAAHTFHISTSQRRSATLPQKQFRALGAPARPSCTHHIQASHSLSITRKSATAGRRSIKISQRLVMSHEKQNFFFVRWGGLGGKHMAFGAVNPEIIISFRTFAICSIFADPCHEAQSVVYCAGGRRRRHRHEAGFTRSTQAVALSSDCAVAMPKDIWRQDCFQWA